MSALRLSEIWIYPIKSLGGVRLQSTKVMQKGLPFDRRWMLVDDQGKFMTQRIYPKMALFKITLREDILIIHYKEHTLNIAISTTLNLPSEQVTIWQDHIIAHEVSKEYSQWFTSLLNIPCKLVHFPEENPRPVDPLYKINNEHVSLADSYPFLIIGQSSLNDLNDRLLTEAVPMNRFRPNLVFTGGDPYEEDTWKNFTIGHNNFVGVKPCSRCVLTTVNQDTAEKSAEPLKTLSSYRLKNNKIYFGQNLVSIDNNEIKEGDVITVKSYL